MRKKMTKEVTKTTVQVAKIEVQDGNPVAVPLEDEILLGNVSMEKAQKQLNRKHGEPVTIIGLQADTTVYEMDVEEFIKLATVREDEQPSK